MTTWIEHRLIVGQHAPFIRLFQTGNDVEQRRFSATARTDDDDEFALSDFERDIIQRVHCLALLPKPFRNMINYQLRRRRTLQFFLQRHQGFSIRRARSGISRRKPAAFALATNLSSASRRISLVSVIRFQACVISSSDVFAFVSSANSAATSFCASTGFFAIQSVSARCASTNFFTISRFPLRNFALETRTVVGESVSSTSTLPPASISRRETHGSTVQTPSTFFCWKSAS